jgi:nucleotide-binding universal stress UspA family protein
MISIKKVLFPTDFSDCAKTAEAYAWALTEQFQAELHVLNVLADALMLMPEPGSALSLPQNYLLDLKQEAERALDKVLPDAAKSGRKVVRILRMGNPYAEIVQYAEEIETDLIVVGTHGRGAFAHLLLGSVAEKVVRKAHCPVLTVRPAGHQFVTNT